MLCQKGRWNNNARRKGITVSIHQKSEISKFQTTQRINLLMAYEPFLSIFKNKAIYGFLKWWYPKMDGL